MSSRFSLTWLGVLCFGSFSWGLRRHFVRSAGMAPSMRAISAVSLAGFAGLLLDAGPPATARARRPRGRPVAACLMAASLALFWWSVAVSGRKRLGLAHDPFLPSTVLTRGPWSLVRHPFYVSYVLFWFGAALAARTVRGWLTFAALAGAYGLTALHEERRLLASPNGPVYAAYRRAVPMFIPRDYPRLGRRRARARTG